MRRYVPQPGDYVATWGGGVDLVVRVERRTSDMPEVHAMRLDESGLRTLRYVWRPYMRPGDAWAVSIAAREALVDAIVEWWAAVLARA